MRLSTLGCSCCVSDPLRRETSCAAGPPQVRHRLPLRSAPQGLDEQVLLSKLPLSLRRQLCIALNKKLFTHVPLFKYCDMRCASLVDDVSLVIGAP